MGNCFTKDTVDRRSARASFFDAKRREKDAMAYTTSQFSKGETALRRPAVKKSRTFKSK